MAKKTWNEPIDKNVDWGGDENTNNLPVSGEMVQRFIKESLDGKAGLFFYDVTNNRYIVFADEQAKNEYLEDPTRTDLIIGTFDAPFNYSAEISLSTPAYNAVFLGSTGNYIDFTFDIKNKQGASTGENVTVTYTFIRNAIKKVVTETRRFGDVVHFNVDEYLGEGTNTIIVGVSGQTTLAATTVAITYQVVNLSLTDEFDVSKAYDLSSGHAEMEVPFTLSGFGTKVVEWYIDGEQLAFVKNEDEVVDTSTERTKYIALDNLQHGRHSLQIRAYTTINGEKFYTDTLYRDFFVDTKVDSAPMIGVAISIPSVYGIVPAGEAPTIYGLVQYVPYTLRFATYSPAGQASVNVEVKLGDEKKGDVASKNGVENSFTFVSMNVGPKPVTLTISGSAYVLDAYVDVTSMDLQEITTGLQFDFSASGRSNNADDKDQWSFGDYVGTFTGFNWNNASGWVNNRLKMNPGTTFAVNYAPLSGTPTSTGKTIELEFRTLNVKNDNAVVCDLRDSSGAGLLITATKVSLISKSGVVIETEYKSGEDVRVSFVVNRSSGTANKCLSFIYANGCIARGEKWSSNDSYASDKEILFKSTEEAEVELKAIRVYSRALSSDEILNNYILYRDTLSEMMSVYDRNDVYAGGIFSPEKMMGRLPVMIVTGDIPTLENTSDKDTQIIVDIEYHNMQDPTRSFKMVGAAMRPQGTSSMGYPKKNFRIYTQKVSGTILYDAENKVVEDKLYAFKKGSQPVDCWCLKADYAESSGTHNTGIARLWNDALMNAQVDGEYKLRTEAQKKALESGYPYDVRTTIDGFPILLFYRPTANDDLIFIGKYNFNNDKSTESVFGFKGIPNFDNSKMQCWEVLNNGNALALFTTVDGFDEGWKDAFESRYPDTKTPDTTYLKRFCEWIVGVKDNPAQFKTEKWEHLDVYKMAAYWCYLMRHAGADQFVKNAMFTSEDGEKFYYILYDNDTINGLINTGHLEIEPTADRQTKNASGEYVFAGHGSVLWNLLEADEEFKEIVSVVDNALYSAGISYVNTIRIFDEEQADKWAERVYNQDSQYKYIGPYVDKGINNLFMLQGKRDLHRKWWLAKRFSIYDAKFVSGTYKSQAIEVKCLNDTPAGQQFSITAGYPLDYGYGINNLPREFGVTLDVDEGHTFTTKEVVNRGDPIRIYAAPHISEVNFSAMMGLLATINVANAYDEALGTQLKKLIVGAADNTRNYEVTEISGLKLMTALEVLDVTGMQGIKSLDLTNQPYLKKLYALHSGVTSVEFTKGAPVDELGLPALQSLSLEQLPYLKAENLAVESMSELFDVTIKGCPNISNDFSWAYFWYGAKGVANNAVSSFVMDEVNWTGVDVTQFIEFLKVKSQGGNLSLRGKVTLNSITLEYAEQIQAVLGDNCFNPTSELFVTAPDTMFLSGPTEVLEGDTAQFSAFVFSANLGTITYSITGSSKVSIDSNGLVNTVENGTSETVSVTARHEATDGTVIEKTQQLVVSARVYPTADTTTINGPINPSDEYNTYEWSSTLAVTGRMTAEWTLSGDVTEYLEISESDAEKCILHKLSSPLNADGVLTLTLRKVIDGSEVLTKTLELTMLDPTILMTNKTNPRVMAIMYSEGLAANETYMTKDEAAAVTADQLQPGTSQNTSIFYKNRSGNAYEFPELEYFTGLTEIPQRCFYNCPIEGALRLPETVTVIKSYAFYGAFLTSVDTKNVTTIESYAFNKCHYYKTGIALSDYYLDVIIRSAVTILDNSCFSEAYVRNLTIEDSDVSLSIPNYCFFRMASNDGLYIPPRVTYIGDSAFGTTDTSIHALTKVTGGAGINTFHIRAFWGQDKITTFDFPRHCLLKFDKNNNDTDNNFSTENYRFGGEIAYSSSYASGTLPILMWTTANLNVTPKDTTLTAFDGVDNPFLVLYENLTAATVHNLVLPRIAYRTFKVTVSGVSNADTDIVKFNLTYTKPDGTTATEVVERNTNVRLHILGGTTITCAPDTEIDGIECKQVSKTVGVSAGVLNTIAMTFNEKVDIFIQHKDGTLYTTDEWNASGNSKDDANGTVLISVSHKFVVAKTHSTIGSFLKQYVGLTELITNRSDGEANTNALWDHFGEESEALTSCRAYVFPCGLSGGYLPSSEELSLIGANRGSILYNPITMWNVWSSSQVSSTSPRSLEIWDGVNNKMSTDSMTNTSRSLSSIPCLPYGKLHIKSNKSDAQFSVTYTKISGSVVTETLGVGNHRLNVKYNTQMTITPISTYDGLECKTKTFTYGWDEEEQSMNYLRGNGVYIQHVDGNLYTGDEWTAGGFANDAANGVAVMSDEAQFVVAKEKAPGSAIQFGGNDKDINDAVGLPDINSTNYNTHIGGEAATLAIIEVLSGTTDDGGIVGAPAAERARSYVFPNGRLGFLGSKGEFALIANNFETFKSLASLIGVTVDTVYSYWTSSVYANRTGVAAFDRADAGFSTMRNKTNNVWPFATL